jgi:hypothetical protein
MNNKEHCGICAFVFERNNYYTGKLMTVRDYCAEQSYFNEKRWLINRMINGWGVVCGLDIQRIPVDENDLSKGYDNEKVRITPGLAIDCCGREILVCEERDIDLIPEAPECQPGNTSEEKLVICLEYEECRTEQQNIPLPTCNHNGTIEYNRIRDSYRIRVRYESDVDIRPPYGTICPLENKEVALGSWEDIKDISSFKIFMVQHFHEDWVKNADIFTVDDNEISLSNGNKSISLQLHDENTGVTLITPDKSYTFLVREEEGIRIIYRNETVHGYLCSKLKEECVKCPTCSCLVLAAITREDDIISEFDPCSKRSLVYSNPLLYDLINCYHGDIPLITDISWKNIHGTDIEWETFKEIVENESKGLTVTFSKPMNNETINKHTFLVSVITVDRSTRYRLKKYIPPEDIIGNDDSTEFTFVFEGDWIKDEVEDANRSAITEGAEFEITLRGCSIFCNEGKALDGSFWGTVDNDIFSGNLPTGKGNQGNDFMSWFHVTPHDV